MQLPKREVKYYTPNRTSHQKMFVSIRNVYDKLKDVEGITVTNEC